MSGGVYLALAGRIRQELEALHHLVQRVQRFWEQARRSADDAYLDATALNLHAFYVGLERVFERIAIEIDDFVPQGPHWHQELLQQMAAPIPGVRPPVLPQLLKEKLERYRGFRHVVRNVYTFHLDPTQIGPLVEDLPQVMQSLEQALLEFAGYLERVGRSSS